MATDTLSLDFGRDKPHYCYLYRDPRPGKKNQPIYVGKGTNDPKRPLFRADYHWLYGYHTNRLFLRVLKKIRKAGLTPDIEIIAWFDIEKEALAFEVSLIARLGRRDLGLGPLLNLTDGGEGTTGYVPTAKTLAKLSKRGEELWANASPELRESMSFTRTLWNDAVHRARRVTNMVLGRANRWSVPGVKEADAAIIRQRKLDDRDAIVAKARAHKKTPEHIKNSGDAKRRDGASGEIGKISSEVWNRPGMRDIISAAISVGQTADWKENEERHETARLNVRKQFADPVKRERHSNGCAARMKADWADPVKREQMLEARRAKKAARKAAEEKLL